MKEILTEAQIYRNLYQSELTEEVEIATEYFYSEGINEFGIDILIDELGIDAFAEFVYDIAEEYTLTEARAAKRRKSGPSVEEVKAKIAAKEAAKKAASTQKPTRSETPAQAKQGIASKIGTALKYAGERAKADTAKVAAAAGTAAGAIHGAAKVAHRAGQEFGKSKAGQDLKTGLAKTAKAVAAGAGTFASKMRAEGYDNFDILLEYLIAEDFAETNQAAIAIMANMSEEWKESILDEAYVDYRRGKLPSGRTPQQALNFRRGQNQARSREPAVTGRTYTDQEAKATLAARKFQKRERKAGEVGKEMDAHTGFGGKVNAMLSPGLADRSGVGPRMAHGEPNTDRHRLGRWRREKAAEKKSKG